MLEREKDGKAVIDCGMQFQILLEATQNVRLSHMMVSAFYIQELFVLRAKRKMQGDEVT